MAVLSGHVPRYAPAFCAHRFILAVEIRTLLQYALLLGMAGAGGFNAERLIYCLWMNTPQENQ